jgi:hypothetical protein
MPSLEDADGARIDVTPDGAADTNARFREAMTDEPGAAEQAPPRRTPRAPVAAGDKPKRGRPPKAAQARTAPAAAAVPLSEEARVSGVIGLVQVPATLALVLGKATGNDAFTADALTISNAGPGLAQGCAEIAKHDPVFAARLDRVCSGGPYAVLIAAGVTMTLQLIRNHRPAASIPGTVHPDELLADTQEVNGNDEAERLAA